ncbi:hypothetical protein Tco_0772097, partial [Tanacetum coccineum]
GSYRPTQSWLMTLASSADKPSKTFDELMSTPIDFFAYIMNGLKITNLTQETMFGPAFRLLKGTRSNYAELKQRLVNMIFQALKTWFQIHGFLLKFPMINMRYGESHIRENNAEVMRKHGYGYLKEIVVRRADNDLYRFKEGDFSHLRINDIEDMLLLRVEDLQLGVESYQKKINVTEPKTTKSGIRKRDLYTPYQYPQGFIYVDNNGRNKLMRPDELYKFSDRTLTGLRTSLDDITKKIRMEYLPNRIWSTLEKKRANIMIKVIDKKLKERRMMRSLEKFVGGRNYGIDLRLL